MDKKMKYEDAEAMFRDYRVYVRRTIEMGREPVSVLEFVLGRLSA